MDLNVPIDGLRSFTLSADKQTIEVVLARAGEDVKLFFPIAVFSQTATGFANAAAALSRMTPSEDNRFDVNLPVTWEVGNGQMSDYVIAIYDKETPGRRAYGLNPKAARAMGKAMIASARKAEQLKTRMMTSPQ